MLAVCSSAGANENRAPAPEGKRSKLGEAFFADPTIREFDLRISETDLAQLSQSPRTYVSAELREGETVLTNVGVHLKGASSFRTIDLKPSFAIKFDQFVEDQTYRGLKKLMFNNSVQDRTYVSELLATELFRDAGLPASRVTHARLRLNGRDLGLYVVVEAMNKDFLKREFGNGKGNLYEAFLQDLDGRVEQDNGDDESREDLRALCNVCAIADPAKRWEQLNKTLDVERFASFIAMELLTGHWDGYAIHFNNYRLYHDPETDRMVFIPHGLDSLFRRPDVSIDPPLTSIVVKAVLTTPEGRALYDQQLRKVAKTVFKAPLILERMDKALTKLRGAGLTPADLAKIERYASAMRERIELREVRVGEQLRGVKPQTVKVDAAGILYPTSWRDEPDRGDPLFDRVKRDGKETLHIRALQESTKASWRSQVFLQPGSYRFEGRARTESLNSGSARLRISADNASMAISGNSPWGTLQHDFIVEGSAMDIELICELYARDGDVWFDLASLRVKRLGPAETDPVRKPIFQRPSRINLNR